MGWPTERLSLYYPLPPQALLVQFWRQRQKYTSVVTRVSQRVSTHEGTRRAVGGAGVTVLNNMLPLRVESVSRRITGCIVPDGLYPFLYPPTATFSTTQGHSPT